MAPIVNESALTLFNLYCLQCHGVFIDCLAIESVGMADFKIPLNFSNTGFYIHMYTLLHIICADASGLQEAWLGDWWHQL